jgi:predicted ATP-dependent serine protease
MTTRHDDGSLSWPCRDCATTVVRYRGEGEVQCPKCRAWYSGSGQRLRDDWQDNPSNYDDEISDLEGFEISQLRKEHD